MGALEFRRGSGQGSSSHSTHSTFTLQGDFYERVKRAAPNKEEQQRCLIWFRLTRQQDNKIIWDELKWTYVQIVSRFGWVEPILQSIQHVQAERGSVRDCYVSNGMQFNDKANPGAVILVNGMNTTN